MLIHSLYKRNILFDLRFFFFVWMWVYVSYFTQIVVITIAIVLKSTENDDYEAIKINFKNTNDSILHKSTYIYKNLTTGGRILQMPVFSAMGRILLMNPKGSEKSSQLGSKTGHSGGGTNSAYMDMM